MLTAANYSLMKSWGLGNAVHVNAYKIAGLVPGSLSLILADHMAWSSVFMITALFMLPGILMTILVTEPVLKEGTTKNVESRGGRAF